MRWPLITFFQCTYDGQWKRIGFLGNTGASILERTGFQTKWRFVDGIKRYETCSSFTIVKL